MPEHIRFEELCALALVGQLSAADSAELQSHLKECEACRRTQADFVELESVWLSRDPEPESLSDVGSTLNQRILCKMQSAGARFSKPVLKEAKERPSIFKFLAFRSIQAPAYAAAAVVLVAAGSILGFGFASHYLLPAAPERVTVIVPAPAAESTAQKRASDAELSAARQAQAELAKKLAGAEAENLRTQARLEDAESKLNALQSANNHDAAEIASLKAVADQARTEATSSQAQLAKLREAQAATDADLVAAQYHAREAEENLAEQVSSLARERQLLGAGREIRDIIGARNLHIVDVADVGNSGVKKPFGRVFYTEGKSLIFYAYDLSNTRGTQTFKAWGQREGDPHSTRALGLLINDDQAQKRWALKFNDPKVLAEIDSVFVTLEPSDTPGNAPKGKKLLNAYLGTPANHP